MMKIRTILALYGCAALTIPAANAASILGRFTASLVGNDLTDVGSDGVKGDYSDPDTGSLGSAVNFAGFDAEFFATREAGFNGGEFSFNIFDDAVGGGNAKMCCEDPNSDPSGSFSIGARLGGKFRLTSFTLTSSNDSPARDPTLWAIQGSNDTTTGFDGTWTDIYVDSTAGTLWTQRDQVIRYSPADGDSFLSADSFNTFRLRVTETGNNSQLALGEMELFGVPEPSSTFALASLAGLGLLVRRRR